MTRDQLRQAADIIRETISARDYAALIGLPVNRAGFAQCPFHSGDHTGSLKLYDGRRGWTCFGCHASGDVIELAKRYYKLNFPQAIAKVGQDAGVPLPGLNMTYEQMQAFERTTDSARQHRADLEHEQEVAQEIEEKYWEIYDEWLEIDRRFSDFETIISRAVQCGITPPDVLVDEFNKLNMARRRITTVLDDIETRRVKYNGRT